MLQEIVNTPRSRVLDLLADHPIYDYNITEMGQKANVSRPTLYTLLDKLVKEGLVIITRSIGTSVMYKINVKSPIIKALMKADLKSAKAEAEKEAKELKR